LFATVIGKITPADLTPASGRQDHTTSPSTSAPFVKGAARVHRIPPPTFVTIAKRPSLGAGPNRFIPVSTRPSRKISENQKSIFYAVTARALPALAKASAAGDCRPVEASA